MYAFKMSPLRLIKFDKLSFDKLPRHGISANQR